MGRVENVTKRDQVATNFERGDDEEADGCVIARRRDSVRSSPARACPGCRQALVPRRVGSGFGSNLRIRPDAYGFGPVGLAVPQKRLELEQRRDRRFAPQAFHVFQDGKEQTIQKVTAQHTTICTWAQDSVGEHCEYSDTPTGKWRIPDEGTPGIPPPEMHFYVIAYAPAPSPDGSCHRIEIKVDRPNSRVYARSQDCNTKHSPSDPLNGTSFGKQLETSLNRQWWNGQPYATIGTLGTIYGKDGMLAARFSGLGCCSPDIPSFVWGGIRFPDTAYRLHRTTELRASCFP